MSTDSQGKVAEAEGKYTSASSIIDIYTSKYSVDQLLTLQHFLFSKPIHPTLLLSCAHNRSCKRHIAEPEVFQQGANYITMKQPAVPCCGWDPIEKVFTFQSKASVSVITHYVYTDPKKYDLL